MSAELAFIFANVFDTLFDYDEKYDELAFKKEINAQNVTDDINSRSKGLRDIWYRCYPVLMNHYKLYNVYDEDRLLNAIEYDNDYAFIPDAFVTQKMLNEHTFMKPIEQDYRFKQLTEQNDRDHFTLKYPVKYHDGLNFDVYAEQGLLNVNRLKRFLNNMDIKWTIHYINREDSDVSVIARRLFNEPDFANLFDLITNEINKKRLTDIIVANSDKLRSFELIPYADVLNDYRKFDFTDKDISCRVTAEMIKRIKESAKTEAGIEFGNKVEQNINRLKDSFNYCLKYPHSSEYLEYVIQHGTVKQVVNACFVNDSSTVIWILKQREDCVIEYLCELVNRKVINRDNFHNLTDSIIDNPARFDIGFAWVKTYKEEPPLMFYPNPNYREQRSLDKPNPQRSWQKGITIADCWSKYVNSSTTPMEMTSMKYYDYMVKSNGVKRNPNQTIMYSYFSNSNENKLIFCKSNVELLDPAVPRYYIPVEFRKLKQYLHEDLLTTDICMFAQLSKNDWEKVAGGKEDIDVVVFNDMKNVYRERTPLKDVIKYLIENIEIEFDGTECAKAGSV
jgi:hypothetical protein